MIRRNILVILLFLLFEGFYLLPEKFVVLIPGRFRLADTIFFILPIFFFFCIPSVFRVFQRFGEETMLVITACAMVLLNPMMALFFFGQPYQKGLLLMRHNLSYLSFFIFVLLLRDIDGVDRLLRLLTFLVGIYILLLLLTKYFPGLGVIHFREKYYDENFMGGMRFGEFRLFFPYADFPIMLYCLNLARLLYAPKTDSLLRRASGLGFILLVVYAILSTFTRVLVFTLLVVTVFALFTSKRPLLRYLAVFLIFVSLSVEVLAVATSGRGLSFLENSSLGKIVLQSASMDPERGRKFQLMMYVNNFLKSPLTGVGTLAMGVTETFSRSFRKYGFFNATDLGYPKIAGEYGLVGLAWVVWFYSYVYRRSRQTLTQALALGNAPEAEAVARGLRYFLIYLVISGFTLPHFVTLDGIPAIVLTLAFMAVTRESLQLRTAAVITV